MNTISLDRIVDLGFVRSSGTVPLLEKASEGVPRAFQPSKTTTDDPKAAPSALWNGRRITFRCKCWGRPCACRAIIACSCGCLGLVEQLHFGKGDVRKIAALLYFSELVFLCHRKHQENLYIDADSIVFAYFNTL
jgi:hypothetical protein